MRPMTKRGIAISLLAGALLSLVACAEQTKLNVVGNHSMTAVMKDWADDFMNSHAGVEVKVVAIEEGPDASPPASLGPSTLRYGPAGEVLSPQERATYEADAGQPPLAIRVGLGPFDTRGIPHAVGIFVHPENPIQNLTLDQLDAIFGVERRRGATSDIASWGDLGLGGAWADEPIRRYGRKLDNSVAIMIQEIVLLDGPFKTGLSEERNSTAVVEAVANDRFGIGFSGLGYNAPTVRVVPIAESQGDTSVAPSAETVANCTYPLNRYLYVFVDGRAKGRSTELARDFITFVLSKGQQEKLVEGGFLRLSETMANQGRKKIDRM